MVVYLWARYIAPDGHSSKQQDVVQEVEILICSNHFLALKSLVNKQYLYRNHTYSYLKCIPNRPNYDCRQCSQCGV